MAAGESSSEWNKFSHIKQVEAYAEDGEDEKKWHVFYTSEPCNIETNIELNLQIHWSRPVNLQSNMSPMERFHRGRWRAHSLTQGETSLCCPL